MLIFDARLHESGVPIRKVAQRQARDLDLVIPRQVDGAHLKQNDQDQDHCSGALGARWMIVQQRLRRSTLWTGRRCGRKRRQCGKRDKLNAKWSWRRCDGKSAKGDTATDMPEGSGEGHEPQATRVTTSKADFEISSSKWRIRSKACAGGDAWRAGSTRTCFPPSASGGASHAFALKFSRISRFKAACSTRRQMRMLSSSSSEASNEAGGADFLWSARSKLRRTRSLSKRRLDSTDDEA
eukprot:6198720-Pleurochrysis_carterae.AAC.2